MAKAKAATPNLRNPRALSFIELRTESYGDNDEVSELVGSIDGGLSSGAESSSPPITTLSKEGKRKRETLVDRIRQCVEIITSMDVVRRRNDEQDAPPRYNKMMTIAPIVTRMEVSKKRGDHYYVQVMIFLGEGDNGDVFLSMENDDQRWIYVEQELKKKFRF